MHALMCVRAVTTLIRPTGFLHYSQSYWHNLHGRLCGISSDWIWESDGVLRRPHREELPVVSNHSLSRPRAMRSEFEPVRVTRLLW